MSLTYKIKKAAIYLATFSVVMAMVAPEGAQAVGQITTRSVTATNPVGGASAVTYSYTFTIATGTIIKGTQFLACTTAFGACTAPTGLTFAGATTGSNPTTVSGTGFGTTTNWVKDATSSANDARYTYTANAATPSGAATFAYNGVTNETGSTNIPPVYIRIYTYDNATASGWNQTGNGTGVLDSGNVVMQPTQSYTVTGTVQEQLTFCVYSFGGACATGMTASPTLGILSSSATQTAQSKFDVTTNANSNVVISYSTGPFAGPSQNIPSGAGVAHTAVTSTPGSEQFALQLSTGTGNVSGTNGYAAAYAVQTNNSFDSFATVTPTNNGSGTVQYMSNISSTTKPGNYFNTFIWQAVATF